MICSQKIKSIYFVGIGGISMSALAKLMKSKQKHVCGCDDNLSPITQSLNQNEITVFKHYNEEAIKNCDLVVYTNAISQNNINLTFAKKLNKPILERAEFLGEVCKLYKNVVAICGTHGKTTTTAMIAHILQDKNPTVHIGGITQDFGDNIFVGDDKIFITEACEYNKSFLHINPTHTVVTNIEKDHMDCYENFNELKEVFHKFMLKASKKVVLNNNFINFYDDFFANEKIVTFSKTAPANFFADNLQQKNGCYSFDVFHHNKKLVRVNLGVVGIHNVENALAAFAMCSQFEILPIEIAKKLETFKNVNRRFQILCGGDVMVISDYAHHPTEIKASLLSANSLKHNKIICIFEPHTYSRTKTLFDEFLTCFNLADMVFILKTYAAREKEIEGGTAHDLFWGLKEKGILVNYFENIKDLFEKIQQNTQKGDIILFLGAGTIDSFAKKYVKTYLK